MQERKVNVRIRYNNGYEQHLGKTSHTEFNVFIGRYFTFHYTDICKAVVY